LLHPGRDRRVGHARCRDGPAGPGRCRKDHHGRSLHTGEPRVVLPPTGRAHREICLLHLAFLNTPCREPTPWEGKEKTSCHTLTPHGRSRSVPICASRGTGSRPPVTRQAVTPPK